MKFRVQRVSVDAQYKVGGCETLGLSSDYCLSLIPVLYEDAQNKTLEISCLTKELFYAGSHRFGITTINIVLFLAIAPLVTKEDSERDACVKLRQRRIELSRVHDGYQYQAK
ncbi:hypothetical protein [Nostoc sp.]|uniref:hypothetical protein n=1 Tax=Nostoc sp. TaxID=1180 RepID=UPI002FF7A583